ncbi:PRC-barrel domain protein [mine drainage metagenome]|uniref:PRC-barrel domain protein n=1 Tax=mine drainage metagenome TaxID=410659 RepID=A0A1J5S1I6_9ZZZZ
MKLNSQLIAGAILAFGFTSASWANVEPSHVRFGVEKPVNQIEQIEIKNFQDESLGRIVDLGVDLVNARIVEVLVQSDSSLGVGEKIVAVPPLALYPDLANEVYRLNVSTDVFKTAPAIDLFKWEDFGRGDRIEAAYRRFGQVPYFLAKGETSVDAANRPKVALGYVERSSQILDMPVRNFKEQPLGKVWSLSLNITQGKIESVIILAPGNFKTRSVVPAVALSFNDARNGLLLDDSKIEFRDEPRYLLTLAAFGHGAYYQQESYKGPHTTVDLEQGESYVDVDTTVRINREMRAAKIDCRHVEVGTFNGRVTLRGQVATEEDKRRIGVIAIGASSNELVDNQIVVTGSAEAN